MEWPPKSGQKQEFPEVDRANWFPLDKARVRIHKGQTEFLARLMARLRQSGPGKSGSCYIPGALLIGLWFLVFGAVTARFF